MTIQQQSISARPDVSVCSIPDADINLSKMVDQYRTHLRAIGRSPATIASYGESLKLLCGLLPAECRPERITAEVLNQILGGLGAKLSEVTLNRHRTAWKIFFRWALEAGLAHGNPAAMLRLANTDSTPTPSIASAEIRQLMETIRRSSDPRRLRDEALFAIYALTGIRRTEALHLDSSDYDAANGILRVRDSKGRRCRSVPVVGALERVLKEFRAGRPDWRGGGRVRFFPGRVPGKCLTARQADSRFAYWRTAAGLRQELTIHSFRVGFATALHRESRDIFLVWQALGHRDIRHTLRYVAPHAERIGRVIERSLAGALAA